MISKWTIKEPLGKMLGCLVALPGRGIPGDLMESFHGHTNLENSLLVVFEPYNFAWYPQPNGIKDQEDALRGLEVSLKELEEKLILIRKMWGLRKQDMAFVGYSAGSVMALQTVIQSTDPYAGVVSIGGAILDTKAVPKAKQQTPILLRHNYDDNCFDWYERYLPMRSALVDKGYNVSVREEIEGGHGITIRDAKITGNFLARRLGYDEDSLACDVTTVFD